MKLNKWIVVGLFALAHLVLALAYDFETPYRTAGVSNGQFLADIGAPDERAHSNYVGAILADGSVPAFDAKSPTIGETYEYFQPPLFYELDAAWGRGWGVRDQFGASAGRILRSLNAVIGTMSVLGGALLAWSATRRRSIVLWSAGLFAFLPMLCSLDGTLSNDPLLICISTWCLAACASAAQEGWNWPRVFATGILAGGAIWTKSSGALLLPAILAVAIAQPGSKRELGKAIATVAVAVTVALPLMAANFARYHDPLAMSALNSAWRSGVDPSQLIHSPRALAHWVYVLVAGTLQSTIGEFGNMDVHLPNVVYVGWWVLLGLLLAGGIARVRRHAIEPRYIVALVFALLLFLAYIAYNLRYVQPQERFLLPSLGAFAIVTGFGFRSIGKFRSSRVMAFAVLALLVTNMFALYRLPFEFGSRIEAAAQPQR